MTAQDSNSIQIDWEFDWERILPNQKVCKQFYRGDDCYEQKFYQKLGEILRMRDPQNKFILKESNLFTINQMASSPLALELIQFLIKISKCKKILEIGTFVGLSTMYFAEALESDGLVVTIEKFRDFADIAQTNFVSNKLDSKIDLRVGDAYSLLINKEVDFVFDLIFIDGNKECYADYLELATDKERGLLSENGLIIIDNVTSLGDVVNSKPHTEKGIGVMACLEKIKNLSEWQAALIPFHDGQIILHRTS